MMISDLPPDLLHEILSRVPATSLNRLRSTCKQWNTLLEDQTFIAKHFRNAEKESMVLMLKDYRVSPMSVSLNDIPPSIDFKGALSLKICRLFLVEVNISTVFHCDGLLLCTTLDNRLLVWNPLRKETIWIDLDSFVDRFSNRFALGYEKKQSRHCYKVFMKSYHNRKDCFKIYEFISDEWRVLDDVNLGNSVLSSNGLSLKGNSYWLARDKEDESQFLLSFDFTLERFKRLSLPEDNGQKMALTVVGEKQLLLLSEYYHAFTTIKMDIWATNEIDSNIETALKWRKSFTFTIPNKISADYCTPVFINYLIDEEKKVAVYCVKDFLIKVYVIGENNEIYREICVEPTDGRLWHSSYTPSLVQVPKDLI